VWTLQLQDKEVKRQYDYARRNNWNDLVRPVSIISVFYFAERLFNVLKNNDHHFDAFCSGLVFFYCVVWVLGNWKVKRFCHPEFVYIMMAMEMFIIIS
jgi:hypothetical protein